MCHYHYHGLYVNVGPPGSVNGLTWPRRWDLKLGLSPGRWMSSKARGPKTCWETNGWMFMGNHDD